MDNEHDCSDFVRPIKCELFEEDSPIDYSSHHHENKTEVYNNEYDDGYDFSQMVKCELIEEDDPQPCCSHQQSEIETETLQHYNDDENDFVRPIKCEIIEEKPLPPPWYRLHQYEIKTETLQHYSNEIELMSCWKRKRISNAEEFQDSPGPNQPVRPSSTASSSSTASVASTAFSSASSSSSLSSKPKTPTRRRRSHQDFDAPTRITFGGTEIQLKLKKRCRFRLPDVEPQSDFDCSDSEADATDDPMIRLRLAIATLTEERHVRLRIQSMVDEQNQAMAIDVDQELDAKKIQTHYQPNKARSGLNRYPDETDDAFVKRMKNNAACRKSRNKSKIVRETTKLRWTTLTRQNKAMRTEMRRIRAKMLPKLSELELVTEPHPLSECFQKQAQIQFVYDRYGPNLYGEESLLLQRFLLPPPPKFR